MTLPIPCTFRGVDYPSLNAAARAHGIARRTVSKELERGPAAVSGTITSVLRVDGYARDAIRDRHRIAKHTVEEIARAFEMTVDEVREVLAT